MAIYTWSRDTDVINFLILLIIGSALFLVGAIFKLYPPKKINPWAGFRTRLAMSSQKLWDEGNSYAALMFIKIGLLSVAVGVVFMALDLADYFWVVSAITLFFALASIFFTDRHLKKFQKK